MGAVDGGPPAIISLSRWFPLRERGTYYGFFSASPNLGEFFSFLFVGSIVTFAGWRLVSSVRQQPASGRVHHSGLAARHPRIKGFAERRNPGP